MTNANPTLIESDIVLEALGRVEELCQRYDITALDDFIASCRAFAREGVLNIAVLGRFKAGKSSFLNQLIGRPLLPVGVIPVTSVVTEIEYGSRERAEVFFTDGRIQQVGLERIREFISESENPENVKQVTRVRVQLPSMERYRGIRFVDTPGLDSVFEHNTDVSLEWLPNAGMALVAVGVDPPLSQHDVELIQNLSKYTPNISLLLTKVDVLENHEREQVLEFVRKQLARYWKDSVPVYPYSVRPGFESLRAEFEEKLLSQVQAEAAKHHAAILRHKLESLVNECAGYLNVALKSAEVADSEREELRRKILGQKEALEDAHLELKLIVRHAAGSTRSKFESLVREDELPIRERLLAGLEKEYPAWTRSLRVALESFEEWLRRGLTREMGEVSKRHRAEFVEPVRRVSRQLSQSLQDFRNRLSERTLETLGVPLRTTEMDLQPEEPRAPDVRVGKVFDRNWELLSWLIPMPIVRGLVLNHFRRKVETAVFTNLSRLVSQWEDIVNGALLALQKEAIRRLDSLIATVERLLTAAGQQAPQIREDLEKLDELRERISQCC